MKALEKYQENYECLKYEITKSMRTSNWQFGWLIVMHVIFRERACPDKTMLLQKLTCMYLMNILLQNSDVDRVNI